MSTWDPDQYLRFREERTQPSKDLVSRIALTDPGSIMDIGCGPGNSTQILRVRWPHADIVGLDNSEKMIERARADYPGQSWIVGDASSIGTDRTYDLVFSNAALQWIPQHDRLIPRLFSLVKEGGALAVQVPANHESALYRSVTAVSRKPKWSTFTSGCEKLITYHRPEYYYDLLAALTPHLALWETTYYHVLRSHRDLIEWYRGTGMRPYLDRLPGDAEREEFEQEVLSDCSSSYPVQKDSNLLYPFKRLFFTAYKPSGVR